jgi:hypothetical protein
MRGARVALVLAHSFQCGFLSPPFQRHKRDCYVSLIRQTARRNTPKTISSRNVSFRAVFLETLPVTQYFFHILDGSEIFADELGKSFASPEEAIDQARCLAAELRKAGDFCTSNVVLVVDEHGQPIFECQAS